MADAVMTNSFRQRIASHMKDNTVLPPITHMAFGDGGHTGLVAKVMDPTRTTLVNELLRKPLASITQEDAFSTTGAGIVDAAELPLAIVSEIALIDSAGNMVGYKNIAPKVKEADEIYNFKVKLRF